MPLLKRKAFEKSEASEYLRDDDEVFHCEITDEIFKDYEEYCERIILVNSMVWSCEMTGKNNLTYSEALDSEKAARRSLKDFPMELRIPILYLGARTRRSAFADMVEDVFNYVRERFFVGETIEACLEGDSWQEAHVLSVTAPSQQPGSTQKIPASSFCYEVEQLEESGNGQTGTVPHDRVRRRKGVFTRDKCRLFLKQFVEMGGGIIGIKKLAIDKYNINKVQFSQLFTGHPPEFPASKKPVKTITPAKKPGSKPGSAQKPGSASKLNNSKNKKISPDKKGKQQSMDKFVKKTDKNEGKSKNEAPSTKPKPDLQAKKSAQELADKMRRAEEMMRQRKEDEKAKKKENNLRLQAYLKEWHRVKDDLELEDHKIIPKGTPIDIEGIPQKHIGDFLSVVEFVHLYAETLKTKDVFHNGLDVETFRKALTVPEHAGLFCDLLQMLLTTIFSLQEDEAEEYNEGGRIAESTGDAQIDEGEMGVTKAVELATKASKWSQTYLGTPLSKLHLDPTTVTEVLRLHILSSGAAPGSRCATWRYQQRGGYSSLDDAGLRLRVTQRALLRRLAAQHAHLLPIDDKFQILQCLMNQILSYATVRDIIEEKLEKYKNMKVELRAIQIQERKREMEFVAARAKLKKEAIAKKESQKLTGEAARQVDKELADTLEEMTKDSDLKKAQFKKKLQQLHSDCFEHLSYVGSDRAYRRYWVNQALGGLFVEAGDEPRGPCLDKPVLPAPVPDDTLAYVTKLFETERASSDKENDSLSNSRGNSPKKPFTNLNGLSQKLNGLESNLQQMRDLMVCTGDISSCFVHGKAERPQWTVYHTEEQIDALINSLNKRGIRESELKTALENDKSDLLEYIKQCPLHMLNPKLGPTPPVSSARLRKFQPSLLVPEGSTVPEALELSLRDYILELEEKIFHGCLGAIKVKDREAWRGTIMLRGYDKQAEYLSWGPNKQYRDDYHLPNGVVKQDPDSDVKIPEIKYRDPGHYLAGSTGSGAEPGTDAGNVELIRTLAAALLQVEQAVHHKYLNRPLGLDDKERKDLEARGKSLDLHALERWEVSLMESRNIAQVLLHLFTLDSSITWSASILNASCRICRRKTDPDNMLLCDSCNKGHHLYCLKPKLNKVPSGDWFCQQCKPKEEKTPRKRRKLFSDDDIEEEMAENSDGSAVDPGLCGACGSGGRLGARCTQCGLQYHRECARPEPTRAARRWVCAQCKNPPREVRRCAAEANINIHHYTRQLNDTIPDTSESEDSEDNTVLVKLKTKRSRGSKEPSPAVNGQLNGHAHRASRKSKEEHNTSTNRKSKSRNSGATTPLTNGHHEEKPTKKRSSRHSAIADKEIEEEDTALHTGAAGELLRDVMRHKDCWPFYEPVSLDDVPDYLEVITRPMDFTTIKNKLEAGEYSADGELVADAAQVFINCYIYNQDTHIVAKAGNRLEKYFNKRCTELDLPTLPDIAAMLEKLEGPQPPAKKPRLK